MSKLTQSKFEELKEDFPKTWKKTELENLKSYLEDVFSDFESQYIFQNCFFHEDTIHVTLFSEGNAFVLTFELKEDEIEESPPEMTAVTNQPWYVRFWS